MFKVRSYLFVPLLLMVLICVFSTASYPRQSAENSTDSIGKKQIRIQNRLKFKENAVRNYVMLGFVNAKLETEVSFVVPDKFITASISLEEDLGLPGNKGFAIGSYIHRFTPSSGLYLNYYGIYRTEQRETSREFIFKEDTIPAGLATTAYFNTQVISTGYLYSINADPNAYLGAFFNLYFMWLDTGIKSEVGDIDETVRLIAPLPNIGIIAMFKLTNWLYLNGDISFFALKTQDFDGSVYNFSAKLLVQPIDWLAIDLGYRIFDIRMVFPYEQIDTVIDYNFRGPSLAVNFLF